MCAQTRGAAIIVPSPSQERMSEAHRPFEVAHCPLTSKGEEAGGRGREREGGGEGGGAGV